MIEKIIEKGNKVDFHIHSVASKNKESDDCVDLLIEKLNQRNINMCSISDHDNFDFEIYNRLKKEENKGSIKREFPAVKYSVTYDKKVLHIITIFEDKDEGNKIYIQNGALEYDYQYDILKIVADNIEGGIDSINERWKRYDKNIYNI